jgi:hypothetical protein
MKSKVYFFIALIISSIFLSAFPFRHQDGKQLVSIKCIDKQCDSKSISKSAEIIKNRLDDYGIKGFEISINESLKSIEIFFSEDANLHDVIRLSTSKGNFGFYETFNRKDVIELISSNDSLFSLLNISNLESNNVESEAILGFCKKEKISKVEKLLTKSYLSKDGEEIRFLWEVSANDIGNFNLYIVKPEAAINGKQIEKVEVGQSKSNRSNELMISLNQEGANLWKTLTGNSIGKTIAVVLDGKVVMAPKVMTEISGGKCSISGNFSKNELKVMQALINSEELPLNMELLD